MVSLSSVESCRLVASPGPIGDSPVLETPKGSHGPPQPAHRCALLPFHASCQSGSHSDISAPASVSDLLSWKTNSSLRPRFPSCLCPEHLPTWSFPPLPHPPTGPLSQELARSHFFQKLSMTVLPEATSSRNYGGPYA